MDKKQIESKRYGFFDFGRGMLMILMALDHASKFYNTGRLHYEGLQGYYPLYIHSSRAQVITRLLGNIAAPGFIFTFGTMVAVSSFRRIQRGEKQWPISRYLIARGLLLIFLQFVVMSRLAVRFNILYCIGCLMILLSFLRKIPFFVLMLLSLFMIMVIPYVSYAVYPSKAWGQYLLEATLMPSKRGLYPFLPWLGLAGIGFWFGVYFMEKWSHFEMRKLSGKFTIISAVLMSLFFLVRLLRGFGNLYIWKEFTLGDFFLMSKYPPSLVFLLWNMALFYGILATYPMILKSLKRWNYLVKGIELYGRVPLFFYIVHLYFYQTITIFFPFTKILSLSFTYLLWLVGLIILYPPCIWFYGLKKQYPNNMILRML